MRKLRVVILLLILLLAGSAGDAARNGPDAADTPAVEAVAYPVTLDGRVIFTLKLGRGAFSAEERAGVLSDRLAKLADDPFFQVSKIAVSESEATVDIVAEDRIIMSITRRDAEAAGKSKAELAADYARRITDALKVHQHDFNLQSILLGLLFTVLATAGVVGLLVLLNRLYRKTTLKVESWIEAGVTSMRLPPLEIIRRERIQKVVSALLRGFRLILYVVVLYTYLHLTLQFFPWTRPLAHHLMGYVLVPLKTIGRAVWDQVPNLFFIAVLVMITRFVLKVMRVFFDGIAQETITFQNFYPEWALPTSKIFRLLVIAFAAVVAFPYIPGSDSPAFRGVSIFLGVLVSLGSQSSIANTMAGVMMTYRRAFKEGDRVKIGDVIGDVTRIRLQVTHMRTIKNEEITVPSATILNSNVINYSALARERGLILHTSVTIGYDTPWRQVHALLQMAAGRTSRLLSEPAPFVLQTGLNDFYVTYELNVYTDCPNEMIEIYSDLHRNIQDAFNEYRVQIMSPHYLSDRPAPTVVPVEKWYAAPAKKPEEVASPGNDKTGPEVRESG
jgi:small-conductance mechanosensitive channel